MKYARILSEFYSTPWAILPDRLMAMAAVLHRASSGVQLSADEIHSAIGDAPQAAMTRRDTKPTGGVMVLPLYGIVSHRVHQVQDISGPGGTSMEGFSRGFRQALADPGVDAIVIDIDSPGGSVFGVTELANEIYEARSQKKIVAVANAQAASAAYWLASAAQELVVTPSGEVGSIGVWTAHEDHSEYLKAMGVNVTLISAGKYKVEGNSYQPLSEEALAAVQSSVDGYYDDFVKAVARNRSAKASDVRGGYGQGRMVSAKDAVSSGMADRVATLDETIQRLAAGGKLKKQNRVAAAERDLKLAMI